MRGTKKPMRWPIGPLMNFDKGEDMLSAIAAIAVAVWFYQSNSDEGRIRWAISGVIVYSLVAVIWTLLITPLFKETAGHSQNGLMLFAVRYGYILAGLAVAAWLNIWRNHNADS